MEIHELNNFSGTPSSGDYLATDNGADTTKISMEELFAPLNERIDNIIAGPASSAQEVIDAREGADGTVYNSLGAAIRTPFTTTPNCKTILPTTFNRTLAKVNMSCIIAANSNNWNDLPSGVTAGTFFNYIYDTSGKYAVQMVVAYPTRKMFSRIVNYSSGSVAQPWKEYVSDVDKICHFQNANPADYSNKLTNVTDSISFTAGPNSAWEDKPSSTGIVFVFRYADIYVMQLFFKYPSLGVLARIVDSSTHTAATDWTPLSAGDYDTIWYALGDSITAGSYSNDEGQGVVVTDAEWSYPRRIERNRKCTVHNLGVPGMAITEMASQVSQVGSDATLVTITGGANDYYLKTLPLGDPSDALSYNTVCGAIKSIITSIANTAPNARIVLISPLIIKYGTINTKWSMNYASTAGFTYQELSDAMKAIAEYYNIEFVDGTHSGPTNILNISNVQKDGVHPTIAFYNSIANWLESKLF